MHDSLVVLKIEDLSRNNQLGHNSGVNSAKHQERSELLAGLVAFARESVGKRWTHGEKKQRKVPAGLSGEAPPAGVGAGDEGDRVMLTAPSHHWASRLFFATCLPSFGHDVSGS